jgi:cysteinyl-tRNA synthetase
VILEILGVMPKFHISDESIETYKAWEEAREKKDYQKADKLRSKLVDEGLI